MRSGLYAVHSIYTGLYAVHSIYINPLTLKVAVENYSCIGTRILIHKESRTICYPVQFPSSWHPPVNPAMCRTVWYRNKIPAYTMMLPPQNAWGCSTIFRGRLYMPWICVIEFQGTLTLFVILLQGKSRLICEHNVSQTQSNWHFANITVIVPAWIDRREERKIQLSGRIVNSCVVFGAQEWQISSYKWPLQLRCHTYGEHFSILRSLE